MTFLPGWFRFGVREGLLFGSEHPENLHQDPEHKRSITRLVARHMVSRQHVRLVVNLTVEPWDYDTPDLVVLHHPLDDRRLSNVSPEDVHRIVDPVDRTIDAGAAVWIHCNRGIDRTGLVVGCCLVSSGVPAEESISTLKMHWPEGRRRRAFAHELWEPVARGIRAYEEFRGR